MKLTYGILQKVTQRCGSAADAAAATALLPLKELAPRHWLLVTLLLSNSIANETLPVRRSTSACVCVCIFERARLTRGRRRSFVRRVVGV